MTPHRSLKPVADEIRTTALIEELYASDAASSLTNRAAREIERLRAREAHLLSIDSMTIVAGPEKTPRDAIRHVHMIAFEYSDWNPATESYGCRGVWRNASMVRPVAQTNEVYCTETEAVAAAAQAFLNTIKNIAVEHAAERQHDGANWGSLGAENAP